MILILTVNNCIISTNEEKLSLHSNEWWTPVVKKKQQQWQQQQQQKDE